MRKWGPLCAVALALAAWAPCASAAQGDVTTALGAGNAAQAEQFADAALADDGLAPADRSRLLAQRGTARDGQGRHDEALADLTQAIDMHALPPADQARALFARGTILDGMGRPHDAIGDYSAALMLKPNFAPALNNRADAWRRLGLFAEAKRDYRASLSAENLQPEYSYYGLGQITEASGDIVAARGFYAQAVAANPHFSPAAERLAALGGSVDTTAADVIHLRAPKPAAVAEPQPALQLRPPRVLPASYGRVDPEPGLRPALDAAGNGAVAAVNKSALIQLGAWRSEEEAGQAWNNAVGRSGGLLKGLSPHIVAADLPGKGRYFRLRAGPAAAGPGKLCAALKSQGVDCIPARD